MEEGQSWFQSSEGSQSRRFLAVRLNASPDGVRADSGNSTEFPGLQWDWQQAQGLSLRDLLVISLNIYHGVQVQLTWLQ